MRTLLVLLVLLVAGCGVTPRWQPPTDAQMASVKVGMSAAEVQAALGSAPDGGTASAPGGETVSSWRVPQPGIVHTAYFNVHFRDGKVVRTSRSADVLSMPG